MFPSKQTGGWSRTGNYIFFSTVISATSGKINQDNFLSILGGKLYLCIHINVKSKKGGFNVATLEWATKRGKEHSQHAQCYLQGPTVYKRFKQRTTEMHLYAVSPRQTGLSLNYHCLFWNIWQGGIFPRDIFSLGLSHFISHLSMKSLENFYRSIVLLV